MAHVMTGKWIKGRLVVLRRSDIEILDGSTTRTVRDDPDEDAEVKRLYAIWKEL